jgi:hypothetical protein
MNVSMMYRPQQRYFSLTFVPFLCIREFGVREEGDVIEHIPSSLRHLLRKTVRPATAKAA